MAMTTPLHLYHSLSQLTGMPADVLLKLSLTFGCSIMGWLLYRIAIFFVERRTESNSRAFYTWKKSLQYFTFLMVAILIGRIWIEGFENLATFLGLLSAGVAIALRDPIVNMAGWLFILLRKPFEVGDRVIINEDFGDVLDISLFGFTMMEVADVRNSQQSTGVIVMVPNAKVFKETIRNFNCKGFTPIWNEIPILVAYDSNWEKAKTICQEIAERHALQVTPELQKSIQKASRKVVISYSKLTPRVYTSIEETGILLSIRYLCQPHQRRDTSEAIMEDVLRAFREESDVELTYPIRYVLSRTVDEPQNPL